eukprot:5493009-Prymnesium_polylepis.1
MCSSSPGTAGSRAQTSGLTRLRSCESGMCFQRKHPSRPNQPADCRSRDADELAKHCKALSDR